MIVWLISVPIWYHLFGFSIDSNFVVLQCFVSQKSSVGNIVSDMWRQTVLVNVLKSFNTRFHELFDIIQPGSHVASNAVVLFRTTVAVAVAADPQTIFHVHIMYSGRLWLFTISL